MKFATTLLDATKSHTLDLKFLNGSEDYLTFNKNLKFVMLDFFLLQVNLEGQQECENELVVFIQASCCVSKNLISEIFNDVCYSLLSFRGLLRPVKAYL